MCGYVSKSLKNGIAAARADQAIAKAQAAGSIFGATLRYKNGKFSPPASMHANLPMDRAEASKASLARMNPGREAIIINMLTGEIVG